MVEVFVGERVCSESVTRLETMIAMMRCKELQTIASRYPWSLLDYLM